MKSSDPVTSFMPAGRYISATTALVLVAFIAAYARVFGTMSVQWWSNDMYSYGYFVPLISFYMVWLRRKQLAKQEVRPNPIGGMVGVFCGVTVLFVGHAADIVTLQEISLMITLPSVVALLWGRTVLKFVLIPIAYLWLMIPIWEELVTDSLHGPFQVLSATLGGGLLGVLGVPVYREGIYLQLSSITLEVARACSGVNYLISIIAIGIPMASLFLDTWGKRIALVVLGVVVAVLSNSVRVALIGLLAYYGFEGPLHGPLHILQGLFVSIVGYAALFGGLWILSNPLSAGRVSE